MHNSWIYRVAPTGRPSAARLRHGRSGHYAGDFAAPLHPLAFSHSSKRWITTNSDGTKRTARQVEASIPVNVVMPIDFRALAPAPVASTSGTTPRMNAN